MWDYLLGEQSWVYCTSVYNLDFPICNYETGSHWRKQAEHNGISVSKYSYVILSDGAFSLILKWAGEHIISYFLNEGVQPDMDPHHMCRRQGLLAGHVLPCPLQARLLTSWAFRMATQSQSSSIQRRAFCLRNPSFFFFLIHSHSDPGLTLCTTGIHTIEPHRDANGSSLPPTLSLLIWLWIWMNPDAKERKLKNTKFKDLWPFLSYRTKYHNIPRCFHYYLKKP